MQFETTIFDVKGNEYKVKADIYGRIELVEYKPTSQERHAGWGYQVFELTFSDINLMNGEIGIALDSLEVMPDKFSEAEISRVKDDAEAFILDSCPVLDN